MTPAETIVARILVREGGVADVRDGKGITRYGQTPAWLAEFQLPAPDSMAQAGANYLAWLELTGLDAIVTVADDLADIVVDIAVMSDHRKAIKALQACLAVTVDGELGPATLGKLALVADRGKLARLVIAWDMAYQGRLITADPAARGPYAAGWANRMAVHVRDLV